MSAISPYFSMIVQGQQELADDLNLLEQNTERKYCRVALRAGAKPIKAAVDASSAYLDRTGLLRSSVRVGAGKGDRPGITSILIRWVTTVGGYIAHLEHDKSRKFAEAAKLRDRLIYKYLGNSEAKYNVYYPRFVEFGHKPNTPPHSFARSSFDATADAAGDIVVESLADQIESA
jgi:HK97 gp10 family phage protein